MPQTEVTKILSEQLEKLTEDKRDKDYQKSNVKQAEEMGIPYPSFNKYLRDTAECGISALSKIADYYGASFDFLRGRTNVKTPNTDIQAVCESTGLSEKAWILIEQAKNDNSINILNLILESDLFSRIICDYRNIEHLWTARVDYSSEKDSSRQQALNEFVEAHHAELDSFQGDIELKNNVRRTKEICKSIQFDIQELQRELQKEMIEKITGIDYL